MRETVDAAEVHPEEKKSNSYYNAEVQDIVPPARADEIPSPYQVDEAAYAAEVLGYLRQQAAALESLLALNSAKVSKQGQEIAQPQTKDGEDLRPASAIDHVWDRLLEKQPMVVETNVIIMNLEGVDTANHTFSANIVAEFRVRYPGDVHDLDPKIRCANLKESTTEPVFSQYKCKDGSYCFRRQWHGVFVEHLELINFPMDIQDLNIQFVSDWPGNKVHFIESVSRKHDSKVLHKGCEATRDVWEPTTIRQSERVSTIAIIAVEDITEGTGLDTDVSHSMITFTLQVRRHATNYLYNIILPTAVLVCLAFCSFTVPLSEVADRSSITLTLLLSIIAYKLIIKDELPKVNFLTLIDKYILASMTIVAMISFGNAAVGHGVDQITDRHRRKDYECRVVLASAWVLCNLWFIIRIIMRKRAAHYRISEHQRMCHERLEKSSEVDLLVL